MLSQILSEVGLDPLSFIRLTGPIHSLLSMNWDCSRKGFFDLIHNQVLIDQKPFQIRELPQIQNLRLNTKQKMENRNFINEKHGTKLTVLYFSF